MTKTLCNTAVYSSKLTMQIVVYVTTVFQHVHANHNIHSPCCVTMNARVFYIVLIVP